ncbi:hypothetical protein [Microbacterium sp. MM2322]|uniref:hypothetical protein n=1 Tax=Microbacterium sp. MM2322 TaxID=3157631 RepID=UPI0032D56B96
MRSLRPGFHLYATTDGSWRLAEPGGRFHRILGASDRLTEIAHALDTGADLESLGSDAVALQRHLRERGALCEPRPSAAEDRGAQKRVIVLGEGTVADALHAVLAAPPSVIRVVEDAADADAIVSIEPWFRDASWAELARRGRPLHRCHGDGGSVFVGPFTADEASASYTDYRGRRRAADPLVDELDALWSHLDSLPDGPLIAPPALAALAAAALAADLFAWASGDSAPHATTEIEIRPDCSIHRHPVLPLPKIRAR